MFLYGIGIQSSKGSTLSSLFRVHRYAKVMIILRCVCSDMVTPLDVLVNGECCLLSY